LIPDNRVFSQRSIFFSAGLHPSGTGGRVSGRAAPDKKNTNNTQTSRSHYEGDYGNAKENIINPIIIME
jgi:hypothetical protein